MKKLVYYIKTWFNIFRNLYRPFIVFNLFYNLLFKKNSLFVIHLRSGLFFKIRNLMDLWVVAETCLNQVYSVLDDTRDKMIIIDIGAAFGDYSIMMAKLYPKSKIYAFEPYSPSFDLLDINIKLNKLTNIVTYNIAVTPDGDDIYFDSNTLLPGNSQTTDKKSPNVTRIKSINFQKFIDNLKKPIDILKIDCEGYEYPILLSLDNKHFKKIKNIVMEYHIFNQTQKYQLTKLIKLLNKNKYQVTVKQNSVHSYLGYLTASR